MPRKMIAPMIILGVGVGIVSIVIFYKDIAKKLNPPTKEDLFEDYDWDELEKCF